MASAQVVAEVVRSGFVEGRHHGSVVALAPDGSVEWSVGDVVMWDNGFTLHRREPFPPTERRLMKRTTIVLPREHHIVPDGALAAAA